MPSNTLGNFDPVFYANEALMWLAKSLGLGSRVYRGFDPSPQQKGSTISIRRPMTFSATNMPSSATDLKPETVNITLDKWKGVTFALTDKELAFTKEQIVNEHIGPAAYAVADAIDTSLALLYKDIPWYGVATSPLAVGDITSARKQLFANGCPMNDGRHHLMLSPSLEEEALRQSAFSQWQGAGAQGQATQQTGSLGMKFGFEVFSSQNCQTHTAGVSADSTGTVTGAHSAGATSLVIGGITSGGTIKAGDTLVIAGNSQRYAVTDNPTADGGGAATLSITPGLAAALSGNEVVTIALQSGEQSLAFHRDAFALAMGVLPDSIPGADVFTVTDPNSGLSVRARRWYDGNNAVQYMGIDALWGVKTLNPNMAYRLVD